MENLLGGMQLLHTTVHVYKPALHYPLLAKTEHTTLHALLQFIRKLGGIVVVLNLSVRMHYVYSWCAAKKLRMAALPVSCSSRQLSLFCAVGWQHFGSVGGGGGPFSYPTA